MAGVIHLSTSCTCQLTVPSRAEDPLVLRVSGDLDRFSHHLVRAALADACQRRPASLVVEIEDLTSCDDGGAALFLEFAPELAASLDVDYSLGAVPTMLAPALPVAAG